MSLIQLSTRKSLLAACLLLTAPFWVSASDDESPADPEELLAPNSSAGGDDMVDRIVFRDETTDQVLDLLERLTGRSIIRPQALPSATFTFNSQQAMTRDEAILALQSMLSINGIGVAPMGDLFLKVVPLTRLQSEAPEFMDRSTLDLPASGRIVSRMISLEFLSLDEVQTQLNLMITQNGGSIIPFPKANSILITDTVSNLQAIERLLRDVDKPFTPRTETNFYPIQYARASELVGQIEALSGANGNPEMSDRTVLTADERSNQIILVADSRQVAYFEKLIEKLDVQADLVTQNEVIFLKHANSVDVASILSQLAGGRAMGGAGGTGRSPTAGGQTGSRTGSRLGSGQQSSRQQMGRQQTGRQQTQQRQTNQRQQGGSNVPQIPGVRAQQADDGGGESSPGGQSGEGGMSLEAAESALGDVASSVSGSDFSESLSILPDERSNAIIISGTRQDIQLITDLIEKIDIILAQVRIEVFIAEVTLSDSDGRGIDQFEIGLTEWGTPDFTLQGPGYTISRDGLDWDAVFRTAKSKSEIKVLSVPTVVTTHNRTARIVVGEKRPIITGTLSDGSFQGSSVRSQIQLTEIAIELEVTPLIGTDGTIQLEIFQTVDDVIDSVEIDGNQQPVIGTRSAESFVSVANRETVVLGGLQSSRREDSQSRLGILGQLPILSSIFGANRQDERRTELLVFIRPTVLATTKEAHEDAQEQIDRQNRGDHIRHQMEPEVYPDPYANEEEPEEPRRPSRRGTGAGGRL